MDGRGMEEGGGLAVVDASAEAGAVEWGQALVTGAAAAGTRHKRQIIPWCGCERVSMNRRADKSTRSIGD